MEGNPALVVACRPPPGGNKKQSGGHPLVGEGSLKLGEGYGMRGVFKLTGQLFYFIIKAI